MNLSIFIELFSGIYRKQVALPGGSRSNRPRRFRPISRRGKCVIGSGTSIPAGRRIPDDRVEGAAQFPKEGERRPARERTLPTSGSPRVCGTRTRTDLHPSTPPARAGSRPEPPRLPCASRSAAYPSRKAAGSASTAWRMIRCAPSRTGSLDSSRRGLLKKSLDAGKPPSFRCRSRPEKEGSTESIWTFHRAERRPRLRCRATPERGIRAEGMTARDRFHRRMKMDSGFRRNDDIGRFRPVRWVEPD